VQNDPALPDVVVVELRTFDEFFDHVRTLKSGSQSVDQRQSEKRRTIHSS
jgi:hypothetical protein